MIGKAFGLTQKGQLTYGIEYPADSGLMHYDFELRLPTVGDNIAAIEQVGVESNLKMNVAILARSLVRLGDIPKESITFDLLTDMVEDDYDIVAKVREELRKKRKKPNGTSPDSAVPSSSSASTASQKVPSKT